VGVAFGGRSVEHDVSIITGLQALAVLEERHRPIPIYLSRSGLWFSAEELRDLKVYGDPDADPPVQEVILDIHRGRLLPSTGRGSLLGRRKPPRPLELDAVVLATHGTEGEDGCLQGALELARIPYVGPPVGAAAAAMDKVMTKAVLAQAGLPVLDHLALRRERWDRERAQCLGEIDEHLSLPVYVKPASLGSSVGVSRCGSQAELVEALELAFELDRVALLEPAVEGGIEVNCAVIGRPGVAPRASVCEQPLAAAEFLSFEDKYMGDANKGEGMKGASRLIPAPIDEALTEQVQRLAVQAFTAFGSAGVTRVDFLIDGNGQPFVNECNTIPGSFSFYLWEPSGLAFVDLMDDLLDLALEEDREKRRTTTVFATNLLAARATGAKS
jgi:D-alanine-D-alanine ligase